MALFTFAEARAAYREMRSSSPGLTKDAKELLLSEAFSFERRTFDVFLSHSHLDSDIVLGVCRILRSRFGLRVYVDLDDRELGNGGAITPETADVVRDRMAYSASLIYAASSNSPTSKWMPWELGYFDGLKGTVAILPIDDAPKEQFKGQEYLGLYPYIDKAGDTLWVNRRVKGPIRFPSWVASGRAATA
jgi:hypothetical protein